MHLEAYQKTGFCMCLCATCGTGKPKPFVKATVGKGSRVGKRQWTNEDDEKLTTLLVKHWEDKCW